MMRLAIACGVLILLSGCGLLPEFTRQPTIHNPFPQLTKVAIVPFFNHSTEPSVDGRQFGLAYFAELQAIPGFEVVPIGTVETAIRENHLSLDSPADVRRLAQLLEVDAVVIGGVTDFNPYYPPRCGLQVEWYAANPNFHPIPPGYGLPWGTPAEADIPQSLVLETEMSLAREQLKTQTPDFKKELPPAIPARRDSHSANGVRLAAGDSPGGKADASGANGKPGKLPADASGNANGIAPARPLAAESVLVGGPAAGPGFPPDWPDPRGLVPPPPACSRPLGVPSDQPVMTHTRTYSGTDPEFTAALENYARFRDDARFGGWTAYLQRSDDFIRFCCRKHIAEMLTARGGAGPSRVVWQWPESR